MGAQTVPWTSPVLRKISPCMGAPARMAKLKSPGLASTVRKIIFFMGCRPMKALTTSLASMKTSIIFTPGGQAALAGAAQQAASEFVGHALRIFDHFMGQVIDQRQLAPATSASMPLAPNMGQTDWHMPHFMQAVSLSSRAIRQPGQIL